MRNVLVSQFNKVNQVVPRNKLPSVYLQLRWNVSSFLSVLFLLPLLCGCFTPRSIYTKSFVCVFLFSISIFIFSILTVWYLFNLIVIIDWVGLAYRLFFTFLLVILISHQTQYFPLFNSTVSTNNRFLVVFRFPVPT